ncbi:MAG: dihydroorotate dehydrogenase PyrD [Candidatus Geothermarchaeota archaeon]
MNMVDLSVKLDKLSLRNPTVLASGILGADGYQLCRAAAEGGFGALTTKSFTYEAREGYLPPIVAYVKAGLLNAVGLTNPGFKKIPEVVGVAKKSGVPVIVSIAGSSVNEFVEMSMVAENANADAIELNLSCPHVKMHGLEIGHDPSYVARIVKEVSAAVSIPVFIKIGYTDNYLNVVSKALDCGARGVTAINTIKGMAIDVYARRPVLSNKFGGLSGPAIHPIAVKVVYDIYKEFKVPIIGVGGVMDWKDAIEFILAGASAVGIGTAIAFYGLSVTRDILEGIKRYMEGEGFRRISELIGLAHEE